jgi:hypothetical protein
MRRQDYSQEIIDQLVYNYQILRQPLYKIGESFGIKRGVAKRILQEQGVRIRTNGEVHRKYEPNKNFFSTENANMAYVLGFIAADGTISKDSNRIKIGLSANDVEHLELIKSIMGINYPIKKYTNKDNFEIVELVWTCEQHKIDLAKYGVVPKKTYTFKFPSNLSKLYWADFIRGYFDGDGSITGTKPEWKICSYKKDVLEKINEFFVDNGIKLSVIHKRNGHELYDLRYASKDSLIKIYNLLYYNNDVPCMKRKKEKFESYKMI